MTLVGVCLAGCGYLDGTEIQEAVCTLLSLDRQKVDVQCFSIDKQQHHVIDHQTSTELEGARNILEESARISRGNVRPLSDANIDTLDALIVPGGYGMAKNMSDFAFKGAECEIDPLFADLVKKMHGAGKPLGFICIAPALAAKILPGITVTIGTDSDTASAIQDMGGIHQNCAANDCVFDLENKVVSTPAYMTSAPLRDIADGIDKCVEKVLSLVASPTLA